MKAVVLTAGKGTRLRPPTDDIPKPIVEIDGRPLLMHCLEELIALEAEKFAIAVGYPKDQIIDHYGESFERVPITYVEQAESDGLADELLQAEPEINHDFMLMLGDDVFRDILDIVVQRQQENGSIARSSSRRFPSRSRRSTASA